MKWDEMRESDNVARHAPMESAGRRGSEGLYTNCGELEESE